MHLAVGTSFSIIIPTSIASVYTHYKYEAVDFSVVKSYGVFVVIGVIIGTIFAASLPTKSLILFFVILLYLLTFNLFFMKDKTYDNADSFAIWFDEEWQKIIDVNLNGTFNCCKAITPYMIEKNYGRIVNIASVEEKNDQNLGVWNFLAPNLFEDKPILIHSHILNWNQRLVLD